MNTRASVAFANAVHHFQFALGSAAGVHLLMHFAVPTHFNRERFGKRVHHRHPDAM